LLAVAALTAGLMALDYRHGVPVEFSAETQKYAPAPEFTVRLVNGDAQAALSDYQGKFVLLNVWASWCSPCIKEFPDLLALAEAYPKKLQLLTLSTDRKREAAQAFLTRFESPPPANVTHGYDGDQKVSRDLLQVYRYPESILISPQGQMIRKYAGLLTPQQLAEIRALIAAE
jgi:thiol-disulfide isomerase/thioredoxin